ncbi:autoinducer synthase [Izhakiella australiensis]|uniref:Acyl-homoserine-lactone synthase n=1 Tax=Izhakiella australiensis TaxID=1926881 RepID=A0A1S8YP18_9GAMM|nr:acyl-homoserine-lactone synthase [Izhakiella australiensis]OON40800.1 autoinducer synthase [Izhakiella australiensis]
MKIIQTRQKDMPSSLLAELGSYRYSIFTRDEGWSVPSRLYTPGQEYDRFDRSEVNWLIAWHSQLGICGCARLIPLRKQTGGNPTVFHPTGQSPAVWEMSRFSARIEVDEQLPLHLLWHALQLAEQAGMKELICAATPMLEEMFSRSQVDYEPLTAGIIQSEDNLFAIRIPVNQPRFGEKFRGSRRFSPEEVLPSLGVSVNWSSRNR